MVATNIKFDLPIPLVTVPGSPARRGRFSHGEGVVDTGLVGVDADLERRCHMARRYGVLTIGPVVIFQTEFPGKLRAEFRGCV